MPFLFTSSSLSMSVFRVSVYLPVKFRFRVLASQFSASLCRRTIAKKYAIILAG